VYGGEACPQNALAASDCSAVPSASCFTLVNVLVVTLVKQGLQKVQRYRAFSSPCSRSLQTLKLKKREILNNTLMSSVHFEPLK
jgi:hypothetical protein